MSFPDKFAYQRPLRWSNALEQPRNEEIVQELATYMLLDQNERPTEIHSALLPRWIRGHVVGDIKETDNACIHTYMDIWVYI